MFSEDVNISYTSTGDSVAIEMLGLISINAKANAMNKFLIMNSISIKLFRLIVFIF